MLRGYYFTYPAFNYALGDIVLFCVNDVPQVAIMHSLGLPYSEDQCAYRMPYLMKKVIAVPGDWVQINESGIAVNGYLYPKSKAIVKHGSIQLKRALYTKFKLKLGQYFVLGISEHSYDSRYLGVINMGQVYRKAFLLLPYKQSWW